MSNRLIIGALVIFASAHAAWAEDECSKGTGTGVWAAEREFYVPPVPLACSRVYTCGPAQTTMSSAECRRVYHHGAVRDVVGIDDGVVSGW
jgi:hypothetical protein